MVAVSVWTRTWEDRTGAALVLQYFRVTTDEQGGLSYKESLGNIRNTWLGVIDLTSQVKQTILLYANGVQSRTIAFDPYTDKFYVDITNGDGTVAVAEFLMNRGTATPHPPPLPPNGPLKMGAWEGSWNNGSVTERFQVLTEENSLKLIRGKNAFSMRTWIPAPNYTPSWTSLFNQEFVMVEDIRNGEMATANMMQLTYIALTAQFRVIMPGKDENGFDVDVHVIMNYVGFPLKYGIFVGTEYNTDGASVPSAIFVSPGSTLLWRQSATNSEEFDVFAGTMQVNNATDETVQLRYLGGSPAFPDITNYYTVTYVRMRQAFTCTPSIVPPNWTQSSDYAPGTSTWSQVAFENPVSTTSGNTTWLPGRWIGKVARLGQPNADAAMMMEQGGSIPQKLEFSWWANGTTHRFRNKYTSSLLEANKEIVMYPVDETSNTIDEESAHTYLMTYYLDKDVWIYSDAYISNVYIIRDASFRFPDPPEPPPNLLLYGAAVLLAFVFIICVVLYIRARHKQALLDSNNDGREDGSSDDDEEENDSEDYEDDD
jgi:hypothetical protein